MNPALPARRYRQFNSCQRPPEIQQGPFISSICLAAAQERLALNKTPVITNQKMPHLTQPTVTNPAIVVFGGLLTPPLSHSFLSDIIRSIRLKSSRFIALKCQRGWRHTPGWRLLNSPSSRLSNKHSSVSWRIHDRRRVHSRFIVIHWRLKTALRVKKKNVRYLSQIKAVLTVKGLLRQLSVLGD